MMRIEGQACPAKPRKIPGRGGGGEGGRGGGRTGGGGRVEEDGGCAVNGGEGLLVGAEAQVLDFRGFVMLEGGRGREGEGGRRGEALDGHACQRHDLLMVMLLPGSRGGTRRRSGVSKVEPEDVVVGGNEAGVGVQGGQARGLQATARGEKGRVPGLGRRRRRGRRGIINVDGRPDGGGEKGRGRHFLRETMIGLLLHTP